MAKKCFVISPIGETGSPIREHVDDVFDYIVKPAAEQTGYVAMRADHDARPGVITEQMYDCILGDELVVAVLSFHNPNVFYELAIAEAAARPLILLIERGQQIPFDIKDRRVLSYDMRPRSLIEGVHVAPLVKAIKELEAAPELHAVPFRPSLSPLGAGGDARIVVRSKDVPSSLRVSIVEEATSALALQGLSLFGMAKFSGFPEAVKKAADRGVSTRVLIQSPENPATAHGLRPFASNYAAGVQEDIKSSIEFWSALAERSPAIELRLQTSGVMFGSLLQSDLRGVYNFYSLARSSPESPAIIVEASSPLHEAFRADFDWAWERATPAAN